MPETENDISEEDFAQIQESVNGYKLAQATEAEEEAIAFSDPKEDSPSIEMTAMYSLLDQLELYKSAQRGANLALVEQSAYFAAKSRLLQHQIKQKQRALATGKIDVQQYLAEAGLSFALEDEEDSTLSTSEKRKKWAGKAVANSQKLLKSCIANLKC